MAWVSACVRLHQLYACVSKLLHSICRGLQQCISSFDFSIEPTTSQRSQTDVRGGRFPDTHFGLLVLSTSVGLDEKITAYALVWLSRRVEGRRMEQLAVCSSPKVRAATLRRIIKMQRTIVVHVGGES